MYMGKIKTISERIAEDSGRFKLKGQYLRPISGIAELFGHTKEHNQQSFVIKANKPDKPALKIGGSEYSLNEFASKLGFNIEDYRNCDPDKDESEVFLNTVKQHYLTRGLEVPAEWVLQETDWRELKKLSLIIKTYTKDNKSSSNFQRIFYKKNANYLNKKDFKRFNFAGKIERYLYVPFPYKHYNEKPVIICEGVPDTLTFCQNGFYAIGLHNKTAIKNKLCKRQLIDFINIVKPKQIVVIPDPDAFKLWKNIFRQLLKEFHIVNLQDFNEKIKIKDANDFLVSYWQGDKEKFKENIMQLINNSDKISYKDDFESYQLDELYRRVTDDFYYDILNENFRFLTTQKAYGKDDFKAILKERLRENDVVENIASIRNQIYVKMITDSEKFIHGDFKIEHGLHLLSEDDNEQIIENDGKQYYRDLEKFPAFDIPKFKEENIEKWYDFLSLFTHETQEVAYHSLRVWMRNIKISYFGLERLYPIFVILYGKHGIGKDKMLVRFLTSFIPQTYIKPGKALTITDERQFATLENALILHFSDMHGFDRADVSKIKEFITTDKLTYRKLGQHTQVNLQNNANCIGTTNKEFQDMYKDQTGERRFVQVELKRDLTAEKIYNTLKKYEFDSSSLFETVDIDNDYKTEIKIIRQYQENEMRYKTAEEEFIIESLKSYYEGTVDDNQFGNVKLICKKNGSISTNTLYQMYLAYCKDNNFKEREIYNKRYFGKRIKPVIENYGFEYNKNNRYYTLKS